jgi:hypothetical protein
MKCSECGSDCVMEGGCWHCVFCGWSACELEIQESETSETNK